MRFLPIILLCFYGCVTDAAQSPPTASPAAATVMTDGDRRQLRTLTRMLSESDRSNKTRTEAAGLLLPMPFPAATAALTAALDNSADPAGRIAVARAINETGLASAAFADRLVDMLGDQDDQTRAAAATALGVYKNRGVLNRLTALAADRTAAEPTRTAAIAALSRRVDKQSIETLIGLLKEPQPQLRAAALTALETLTGIRRFGDDEAKWSIWWRANRDKPRQQWLADQVDSLARQNADQQQQIDRLGARLGKAMSQVYTATAPAGRPTLVLTLLKDPVAEIRLIGLTLAAQRAGAGETLAPRTLPVLRAMLADADHDVRANAATLTANLNDTEAVSTLIERLEVETAPLVRQNLIAALGALRDPIAVDVLLGALAAEINGAAVQAAIATERLADHTTLTSEQIDRAVAVITERYGSDAQNQPEFRGALLGVMRVLNRAEFAPAMRSALGDELATIRLEAVRGLQKLGATEAADDIAALTADPDRGVRQTAIASLAALGGPRHLDLVLNRTSKDIESDAAVRQRAWDVAMTLMERADNDRVADIANDLAESADSRPYRIAVLEMLIARLNDDKPRQAAVQGQLAEALLLAGRPAEAAEILAATHEATPPPERAAIWLRWIGAMLAADDGASLTLISEQTDPKLFAAALGLLNDRLASLDKTGQYQPLVAMADLAAARLKAKVPAEQLADIIALRAEAMRRQQLADRQRVAELIALLETGDVDGQREAEASLLAMQRRAVRPLVQLLQESVTGEHSKPALADRIVKLLARIAPELTGYDPDAVADQKAKLVETWMVELAG